MDGPVESPQPLCSHQHTWHHPPSLPNSFSGRGLQQPKSPHPIACWVILRVWDVQTLGWWTLASRLHDKILDRWTPWLPGTCVHVVAAWALACMVGFFAHLQVSASTSCPGCLHGVPAKACRALPNRVKLTWMFCCLAFARYTCL